MKKAKYRILISEEVSPEAIQYLQDNNVEVKTGLSTDEDTVIKDIQDCDAVMVRVMRITENIIKNSINLKVIAKHGVGCDSIDTVAAQKRNIPIVYTPGANSISVAEHTMMLILACARQLRKSNIEYGNGNYRIRNTIDIHEIYSKTLALIGCGNIASSVARMAKYGFDMKVIGYDPHLQKDRIPEDIILYDNLRCLFLEADFLSIHIPATEANKNFIDAEKISMMKPSAYLINTSRGTVVDNEALLDAIRNHRIAGAGLDVCNPEPVMAGSEYFSNPDIILTPHSGAASKEAMVKMGMEAAKGVVDVLNGRTPKNLYTTVVKNN